MRQHRPAGVVSRCPRGHGRRPWWTMPTVAWLVAATLGITGCTGSGEAVDAGRSAPPSTPATRIGLDEPCPDGVTLGLGAPFRGRDYAKFQTPGGTVYVSVGQFRQDRADGPDRSTIYIGALARPPTYDPQEGRLRGTIATMPVIERTWSAVDLTEGRYWLTASDGWDIAIRSCEPAGLADASTFVDAPASRTSPPPD